MSAQFIAFTVKLVPTFTKEEFKRSISESLTPVLLSNDSIELHISMLRGKYMSRERVPCIMIMNKEISIQLRLILEDFIRQMLTKVKDVKSKDNDWLFPFFKLLESVFHTLVEKAITKQLTNLGEYERMLAATMTDTYKQKEPAWSESEVQRLEHAFRMAKFMKGVLDRWYPISLIVESRDPESCEKKCR